MPYPEAAEFAAHIASLRGLRQAVDVAGLWSADLAIAYPILRATSAPIGSDLGDCSSSVVLFAGSASEFSRLLDTSTGSLESSPLLVIAIDDAEPALSRLAARGMGPAFLGRTRASESDAERSAHLIVVDRTLDRAINEARRPPEDFRVVAIMAAYNEEDIIGPAIEKLIGDGVGVYVIDNWSTDRTREIAASFEGRGLVGLERFPASPDEHFVLRALLARTAKLAATMDADWFIHHDADERRCGPWPGVGLREALWRVDRAGFNAVDFTVVNYRPIDDSYVSGSDFERHFCHFEFGATSDLLLQVKAWKKGPRVDLAGSAGHQARFADRRVFPYKFLLKHYPIRSQAHGERKIFRERLPRWDRHERVRGWHVHYDAFESGQSFLRDPAELIEDRGEETWARYLPEALTGAGLVHREFPEWALRGGMGRRFYLGRQAVERSTAAAFYREVTGKPRGLARRIRRGSAGRT